MGANLSCMGAPAPKETHLVVQMFRLGVEEHVDLVEDELGAVDDEALVRHAREADAPRLQGLVDAVEHHQEARPVARETGRVEGVAGAVRAAAHVHVQIRVHHLVHQRLEEETQRLGLLVEGLAGDVDLADGPVAPDVAVARETPGHVRLHEARDARGQQWGVHLPDAGADAALRPARQAAEEEELVEEAHEGLDLARPVGRLASSRAKQRLDVAAHLELPRRQVAVVRHRIEAGDGVLDNRFGVVGLLLELAV